MVMQDQVTPLAKTDESSAPDQRQARGDGETRSRVRGRQSCPGCRARYCSYQSCPDRAKRAAIRIVSTSSARQIHLFRDGLRRHSHALRMLKRTGIALVNSIGHFDESLVSLPLQSRNVFQRLANDH